MPISPARVAGFEVLLRVEKTDAYASELLHAAQHAKLSAADHGLATEVVMGVLRWRSVLDQEIAKRSSLKLDRLDPEVLTALRLTAYQLLFLDRVPERAAVHEGVELVKRARKGSAAPFANAVLRKFVRSERVPDSLRDSKTASELAGHSAHPEWLVERWVQRFGIDPARQICMHDQRVPETSINIRAGHVEAELKKDGITLTPGRLLASARRVAAADVSHTGVFREREVVIQDEASQLVAFLIGSGSRILDCCAAPGGKTRLMAERNPAAGIVAADVHPHRARLLRKLVPAKNVQVIVADACNLPTSALFDRVLVDVPCSGTGTLARNPEIKWRLKPEDLLDLQARQISILRSAMRRVAPGGILVYSTCSLEEEENQTVVQASLSGGDSFRILDCRQRLEELKEQGELAWEDLDSLTSGPFLRTVPGLHPCDGFFAAILERV